MSYKYQIEQELLRNNWEIDKIDFGTEWWEDESWKIRFKFDSKIAFYLCFIVDPMFEGNRKKGQGIYEIKACTSYPTNWNDNESTIASIQMSKRKFNIKLKEMMNKLENYKIENNQKTVKLI